MTRTVDDVLRDLVDIDSAGDEIFSSADRKTIADLRLCRAEILALRIERDALRAAVRGAHDEADPYAVAAERKSRRIARAREGT
jgi:hypothetical protein